jgi:pyruvate,water dikinase
MAMNEEHHDTPQQRWERIAAEAKIMSLVAKAMISHVERLQTFLGLRETAKHHFMRGYALIRKALVELDRRFKLNGGIFYLTPDELPRLIQGADLASTIDERRKYRSIALSLETPPAIFSDDLEAIGRPQPAPEGATQLQGIALSAGVAEGPALVLSDPAAAPTGTEGYVLVCPSTDPAWVPLFVKAKALVMESGGALSHGAIVAREFGLPAVAGLPGIHRQLQTGQKLRVDGGRGTVSVLQ